MKKFGKRCWIRRSDTYTFYFNAGGRLHRLGGPACEYTDGGQTWYVNGKKHREDGPAVEWKEKEPEWFLDGKGYSKVEFDEEMKRRRAL